jgi:hypothetical protein
MKNKIYSAIVVVSAGLFWTLATTAHCDVFGKRYNFTGTITEVRFTDPIEVPYQKYAEIDVDSSRGEVKTFIIDDYTRVRDREWDRLFVSYLKKDMGVQIVYIIDDNNVNVARTIDVDQRYERLKEWD